MIPQLSELLTALRDVSFAAAQDQPRNRQGHFGARIEDGASGIGAGGATDAEHGGQLAAARRYQAQRPRLDEWLRGNHDPAWGSEADNRAMVARLDALIARNQLVGELAVYVAYDGPELAKLLGAAGEITERAFTYGSRQQSIARAAALPDAYVARVATPAGMDAYLFPEVSDPAKGVLLPRGLTITVSSVNAALRTIGATAELRGGTKLGALLTVLRDASWLYSDDQARDDHGRWSDSGGGSRSDFHVKTSVVGGKLRAADGSALPAHIEALKIPPGWSSVTYNPDPQAALLAQGRDSKGRVQSVYAQSFSAEQAQAKFARISALSQEFPAVHAQNEAARTSGNLARASHADATALIMHTGIRPGSETDQQAKVQAYGATTLEGQHVVQDAAGHVSLQFVGKKGVPLSIPIHDASIASMLLSRKTSAGDGGQVFPLTSDSSLLDHIHTLGSGAYKAKDFRTLAANTTAAEAIAALPVPATQVEYRRSVMSVAKTVSARLGNTPTVALQSYINPHIFASWKGQAP